MTVSNWPHSTVLITGGTGSFGSAFTHFLLHQTDARIRLLSRCEYKQAQLRERIGNDRVSYLLGDVRDRDRLELACRGVDLVVHAAALKRVDALEYNPLEAIRTNIEGSSNVVRACIDTGVKHAILLSSDKAAQPLNVYGASKLVAEKLFVQANSYSKHTRFVVTRYGNVMGSRGSVLEVFEHCQRTGKRLPVTDLNMTRFWMTMDQAVHLVAGVAHEQLWGGIVLPHLPAFGIDDLCSAILGVKNLDRDHIDIQGIRPGEKLHETLMLDDEADRAYQHSNTDLTRYFIAPAVCNWQGNGFDGDWLIFLGSRQPYRSDVWSWRLNIDDLRTRLGNLDDKEEKFL